MSDHEEPNLDGDGGNSYSSSFQRTVVLRDWWLIKCSNEFEGKRFGVAGTETSFESRAMRVFTSSPIIKALDVFTLKASDGLCITLRGFLNKERVVKNGFKPEICREFIFGFPPCWERICNNCFQEDDSFGIDHNTVPSTVDKASSSILSPCKHSKGNLEDNPAESRDKSTVTETNIAEINSKAASRVRGEKTATRKSLRLQSKSGGKIEKDQREQGLSKVQNTTIDEDVNKAKSSNVEKDECEAINNDSKDQNCTSVEDHVSEGFDKAKNIDVEKDECEATNDEVISPANGCGRKQTGADDVDKVTSTSATGESLTSEQPRRELTASPQSLFKDLDKSGKHGKKSKKTLEIDGNVVEPRNHSRTKVKSAEKNRKLDVSKIQNPTTNNGDHGSECLNKAKSNDIENDECVLNEEGILPVDDYGEKHSGTDGVEKLTSKNDTKESLTSEQRKGKRKGTKTSLHSLSKDLNNSSKPGKSRKSKKGEKTLKSDSNIEESMNHSRSEVKEAEEDLSWGNTKRKIDFDVEVTPEKQSKKQKTNVVSTDSLGQKRSRSGRLLVSSLEFWRNQIPVYDMDRNLVQVVEGSETKSAPSKGKGSKSRKVRS